MTNDSLFEMIYDSHFESRAVSIGRSQIVNAVYLYDDKLVIAFNYKEASKTVTLKEVNGSIIECSGAPKQEGTQKRASLFLYKLI